MSKHQWRSAHFTEDTGNSYCNGRLIVCPSLSNAAYPNSPLFHRHPVVAHCSEEPCCYHKEALHSPVVCSPDDTTEICQEAGPAG